MDSFRKSSKSNNSLRHLGRADNTEEEPILLDIEYRSAMSHDQGMEKDVVVLNIDRNSGNANAMQRPGAAAATGTTWRDSSDGFWNDRRLDRGSGGANANSLQDSTGFAFRPPPGEDAPSKLIGQFLNKQRDSGDVALDMDLNMMDLGGGAAKDESGRLNPPPSAQKPPTLRRYSPAASVHSSKDLQVSFEIDSRTSDEGIRRRSVRKKDPDSSDSDSDDALSDAKGGEVLGCSSLASMGAKPPSLQRKGSLLRTKTKSRLMDPPRMMQQPHAMNPSHTGSVGQQVKKSGILKSGMLGGGGGKGAGVEFEEEEDPFLDEDLPNELKRENVGAITIVQWLGFFLILGVFVGSLGIPFLSRTTVWGLHIWKWALMGLVVFCGRLVSGWGIRIVVFFIERNFILRKRLLYFVYGLRKAVQDCVWLGLVLIAWHFLFDKKVERETKNKALSYVTKILVCFLVATLIWLVKTLLVKVLASSFHVSAYFDRIQDSLFNQYVIETLSGPPLIEIQQTQEEEEKVMAEVRKLENAGAKIPIDIRAAARGNVATLSGKSGRVNRSGGFERSPCIGKSHRTSGAFSRQQEGGITIDHLHKLNQKNVSAWNMKRLMNIVRRGVLTTLDESIHGAGTEDEHTMQILSEFEAKAAARKIFHNVAQPGAKYITLIDLMRFMTEEEAVKALSLFEGTKDASKIGKSALKNWVVNAFRERRALSLTLNDTKTAVNKLHQMVNIVVGAIILIIWLLILGIATTHLLVFVSSQLLLAVFIFGNTCKTVFESIIFLFAVHPFDVGDRCEIDGVQMIVEEMNILTTVFLRYDNQKITYPNSVLCTKPISNFYRSPDMGDAVDFCVHLATPAEKIAILKERIKSYIESRKDHWYPDPMVIVKDVKDMNKLEMAVWLRHHMNHQDMGERWQRRALLVEEMVKIFRELDVEYRLLPVDVNLRSMPPVTSARLPSTWMTA
ncbi:mechanosensitive ion channel protein 6-like isoform X1 [Nymphaea colorata]|nr:mechanosensitive ion channel protein 6-like isoform X1 [Nymphaea colorata]